MSQDQSTTKKSRQIVIEPIHWIAISDELPDSGIEVLVCFERNDCEERDVAIGVYDVSNGEEIWSVDGWPNSVGFGIVMYWAEKPAGPSRN